MDGIAINSHIAQIYKTQLNICCVVEQNIYCLVKQIISPESMHVSDYVDCNII